MAPFPWKMDTHTIADNDCSGQPLPTPATVNELDGKNETARSSGILGVYQNRFPHFAQELAESKALKCIAFELPQLDIPAGRVLRHSVLTLEKLFKAHCPMIFKIGFTHSPSWRWSNTLYGYSKARDRWSNMLVMYVSSEPYSPAMLEAALIDKFGSNSTVHICKVFLFKGTNPCKLFCSRSRWLVIATCPS